MKESTQAPGLPEQHQRVQRAILTRTGVALALAILAVGLSAVVAWRQTVAYEETVERMADAAELRAVLASVLQLSVDEETGQRGYVLTGDGTFLQPFEEAEHGLPGAIEALRARLRAPDHRDDLVAITSAAADKRAFSLEVIALVRAGRPADAEARIASGEGRERMERLREAIAVVDARLSAELTTADREVSDARGRTRMAMSLLGALAVALAVAAMIAIRRDLAVLGRDTQRVAESAEELRDLAEHDPATGLWNRRGLTLRGTELMEAARDSSRQLVVFFCDLDGLKEINDQLGHDEGDRASADAASALRDVARAADVIARIGGDELVVLGFSREPASAEPFQERLRARLARHDAEAGRPYRLSMSVGAVDWSPGDGRSLEDVLTEADAAMYREKKARRSALTREGAPIVRTRR